MEIIKDLPEGLRRDIKRFLCLDLIKQVPLFHSLDDLILDNICDRVKPILISKGEKVSFLSHSLNSNCSINISSYLNFKLDYTRGRSRAANGVRGSWSSEE